MCVFFFQKNFWLGSNFQNDESYNNNLRQSAFLPRFFVRYNEQENSYESGRGHTRRDFFKLFSFFLFSFFYFFFLSRRTEFRVVLSIHLRRPVTSELVGFHVEFITVPFGTCRNVINPIEHNTSFGSRLSYYSYCSRPNEIWHVYRMSCEN